MFNLTTTFHKICDLKGKIHVIQGGSSASKTYSKLQYEVLQAYFSDVPKIVSIVTDTYPNLKSGAWQDFKTITEGYCDMPKNINDIELFGWLFQFIALDKASKALGGRRDRLFLNEGNRMDWDIARHMIIRTRDHVCIDFNPDRRFWVHEKYIEKDRCDFVTVTYHDNQYAPQFAIDEIEAYKDDDPEWYKVYDLDYLEISKAHYLGGCKHFLVRSKVSA